MQSEGKAENTIVAKSYKKLFDFLQDNKYDKQKHLNGPTHTRIGCKESNIHGGSYVIPDNNIDEFHTLYYHDIIQKKKKNF